MRRMLLTLFLLVAASVVGAQQEDGADVSFDGLVKQQRGLFKESWVDLDVDFLQYTKIMLVDPYFEFRAVKRTASGAGRIPSIGLSISYCHHQSLLKPRSLILTT